MDDRYFVALWAADLADVVDADAQLAGLVDGADNRRGPDGGVLSNDDRARVAVPGAEAEADGGVLVGADAGECRGDRARGCRRERWVMPPLTVSAPVNVSVMGLGVGVVTVAGSSPQLVNAIVAINAHRRARTNA